MALLGEVFVWGGNADDLEVMRDVRGCKYVEFLLLAIHKPFALPTVLTVSANCLPRLPPTQD